MSNKVFKGETTPIPAKLAPKIQQEIMNKIQEKYPGLGYLFIGSVGKKGEGDFNGDIDIAILCNNIQELEYMVKDVFGELSYYAVESLYIVSIKYPFILDGKQCYTQCDFMIMQYPEYTEFRYWCPNYANHESKYKVGTKIMFANMVLNHCAEKNNGLNEDEVGKFDFRPTALYRWVYKVGNNLYKEEYITHDPKEIASYAFKDADTSHFNTVETLWDAIHTDNFKYPDEVATIERNFFRNCFRKGWTSILPENFILKYNTIEDIYKVINQQRVVNEINRIGQRGKEI